MALEQQDKYNFGLVFQIKEYVALVLDWWRRHRRIFGYWGLNLWA